MARMKQEYTIVRPEKKGWSYRFRLGDDPARRLRSTGKRTRREAEMFVKTLLEERKQQKPTVTFNAFTEDFFKWGVCPWIKRRHASGHQFSKSMAQIRRGHLMKYLRPQFGNLALESINVVAFEDWRLSLKLSNSTLNHLTGTMSIVMREAKRQDIIGQNQFSDVERLAKVQVIERDALAQKEIKKLFPCSPIKQAEVWSEQKYFTFFSLLLMSGMRSGEARALVWSDVCWSENAILVTKALKNDDSVGRTKNGHERVVIIPSSLKAILAAWKGESQFTEDRDLIFYGSERTRPFTRTTEVKQFRLALNKAKIESTPKSLVPHSLRHTYNTMMKRFMSI